jgi:hypothetical protein
LTLSELGFFVVADLPKNLYEFSSLDEIVKKKTVKNTENIVLKKVIFEKKISKVVEIRDVHDKSVIDYVFLNKIASFYGKSTLTPSC